jgi:hypothetical protein
MPNKIASFLVEILSNSDESDSYPMLFCSEQF